MPRHPGPRRSNATTRHLPITSKKSFGATTPTFATSVDCHRVADDTTCVLRAGYCVRNLEAASLMSHD